MFSELLYLFTFVLASVVYFACSPTQKAPENFNVVLIDVDSLVSHFREKNAHIFVTAEWCGGCKLTFTNVYLEERELYENEVFYFGSLRGLDHYLVDDDLKVYWISNVSNTPFHHKNAISNVLSKMDALFEYDWGFPVIFEYRNSKIIQRE